MDSPDNTMVTLPDGTKLSPDDVQRLEEALQEADRLRMEQERAVLTALQSRVDDWVTAKADIEKRWVDDLRQYEGYSRVEGNVKDGRNTANTSGPPTIHRTRSRTDMMEARLSDMLLTNQAWDLRLPKEVVQQFDGMGQPAPEQQIREAAEATCAGMKNRIADILAASKFATIGRRMVRDACRIGTGLLIGPRNVIRYKRRFNMGAGSVDLQIEERPEPEIAGGDPWCFYPEPVECAEKAQGAAYVHLMSRVELQEFAKHPGVSKTAIAKILKSEPELGKLGPSLAYRNRYSPFREETAGRYAVWRYVGILEREEAAALGLLDAEAALETEAGEPVLLPLPMVDIYFCQGEVLRTKFRPMEGDFRIPYYVYSPFPADDTMFGYGLPYLARDSQRAADAAYQIMLHNASVSSGPVVFARREAFTPTKGDTMEINGPKWLWVTDQDVNIQDVVHVVQFPNNANEAMAVLDRILTIMDDELNMPQIVGDATATKPSIETASGMAMALNQLVTVIQRRAAAAFDDDVIVPMVERLYWWEMLYGDNDAIKGEYEVEALGQSTLLVKDIRAQHLMMFMQLFPGDPEINAREIKTEIAKMLDLQADRVLLPIEQVQEAMKNQGPNPEVMKAEASAKQAEAALERARIEAQNAERDDAFRKEERMLTHRERMAELEHKEQEAMKDLLLADLKRQTEMAKLAQQGELKMAELAATLNIAESDQRLKEFLGGAKVKMEAHSLAQRERNVQAQIRHESPVRIAG